MQEETDTSGSESDERDLMNIQVVDTGKEEDPELYLQM